MSVTVVSCVYGGHRQFVPAWVEAIHALDPAPDEIIVASDAPVGLPADVTSIISACPWRHPQAYYLNLAIRTANTEWVWIADIDDQVIPDGLAGLGDVWADVWQLGFNRSDGERYTPPHLTADEFLEQRRNVFVGASMIRTATFRSCGGFRDVALQDWDLWRRLAHRGASFQSSDRAHFRYMLHPARRGETELTLDVRGQHMLEMILADTATGESHVYG